MSEQPKQPKLKPQPNAVQGCPLCVAPFAEPVDGNTEIECPACGDKFRVTKLS